jgi:DeoR family transcriptional regulator, glycerol-3-phosphate regulon repressor
MEDRTKAPKAQRQERILAMLRATSTLRVADLAADLDVSTETIRRDLDDLTTQGLLNRTYGGAVRPFAAEPALETRHHILAAEREAMARIVAPLVEPGQVVAIGGGATTLQVARRLAADLRDLTVLAHSFGVATVLALNPTIVTLICPGYYHGREGAIYGVQAVRFLQGFNANWAIVGSSGLTGDGPGDIDADAAAVYGAMVQRAARTIVVADHTKFDRPALAIYANWRQVSLLVTDQAPAGALARALCEARVEVAVAPAPHR